MIKSRKLKEKKIFKKFLLFHKLIDTKEKFQEFTNQIILN